MSDDLTPPHWGAEPYEATAQRKPVIFGFDLASGGDETVVPIRNPTAGLLADPPWQGIDQLPAAPTEAEVLAAAVQLPEVRALVEASTQFAKSAMSGSDLGWALVNLDAALAPFTEASA